MSMLPTIQEIKEETLRTSPHFFDEGTLKWFGQTMRTFKVRLSPEGRVFIYARMTDRHEDNAYRGFTFREFTGEDLKPPENGPKFWTMSEEEGLQALRQYIKEH